MATENLTTWPTWRKSEGGNSRPRFPCNHRSLVQAGYIHRGRREYPRWWIAINWNTASLRVTDGFSWQGCDILVKLTPTPTQGMYRMNWHVRWQIGKRRTRGSRCQMYLVSYDNFGEQPCRELLKGESLVLAQLGGCRRCRCCVRTGRFLLSETFKSTCNGHITMAPCRDLSSSSILGAEH